MADDARVDAARVVVEEPDNFSFSHVVAVLDDLLAYAEERLRVNVGLLQENTTLKTRSSSSEFDLSEIPVKALFQEINNRFYR